jgi:hypothetical protein
MALQVAEVLVDSCRNTPPGGLVGAAPWSRSGLILPPSGADTAARKKLVVGVGLYVLPSPREVTGSSDPTDQ